MSATTSASGDLRRVAARGTLVNGAFMLGLNGLTLIKGFVVAIFLSRAEYGVWGVLVIALTSLLALRQVGVNDKFVQQDEPDQELAFQKAFTLEVCITSGFALLTLAATPCFAAAYGWQILAPGLVVSAAVLAVGFQSPVWVYYRRMDFARQRALQAVDPLAGFVVTVALAIAGLGYWSLVAGVVVGGWAAALVAVRSSPYPLRLRFDRATARAYVGFSWPVLVGTGSLFVMSQAAVLVGKSTVGFAGLGAIALATTISMYADRADQILTQTLYPVVCRVKERTDLLYESFVKSNRLALMWGLPFGVGLALFAPDLTTALGARWKPATTLLQAFGLIAAFNHVGFNWTAYYRARSDTWPLAKVAAAMMVAFGAATVPLTITHGLDGYAIGMAIVTVVAFLGRSIYLTRLFSALSMLHHALRAWAPTVPAAVAVLLVRLGESAGRPVGVVIGELALYAALTLALTALLERRLLAEAVGYLRRGAPIEPAGGAGGGEPLPGEPVGEPISEAPASTPSFAPAARRSPVAPP